MRRPPRWSGAGRGVTTLRPGRRAGRRAVGLRTRLAVEHGNSPVTAVFGVMMFLLFLLLAAQTTIHLYGVSTSTAIMFDEARRVAASMHNGTYSCQQAEERVHERLGGWGERLQPAQCTGDDPDDPGDVIRLRVRGPSPANLLAGVGNLAGLATFDRTVQVHKERFQP
jgi:hypothetical protein